MLGVETNLHNGFTSGVPGMDCSSTSVIVKLEISISFSIFNFCATYKFLYLNYETITIALPLESVGEFFPLPWV